MAKAHSSWGPGWPNCQTNKIDRAFSVHTKWGLVSFPGGVRREITELVSRLVKETANRGYRFGVQGNASYGCWGYLCRPIGGTRTPSIHSWGLAIDINAPRNPMTTRLITDMPGWMPDLWNAYGFRWGGDYVSKKDAMHYEFLGSVADAKRLTELARKNRLGENRKVKPKPTTPVNPPAPELPEEDKMYALMKGDKTNEVWLTDMLTRREMRDQKEIDFHVFVITAGGGKVKRGNGNKPEVWPQEYVDNIQRSDRVNLTDAALRWYDAAGDSPLHDIVEDVVKAELEKATDPE